MFSDKSVISGNAVYIFNDYRVGPANYFEKNYNIETKNGKKINIYLKLYNYSRTKRNEQ